MGSMIVRKASFVSNLNNISVFGICCCPDVDLLIAYQQSIIIYNILGYFDLNHKTVLISMNVL